MVIVLAMLPGIRRLLVPGMLRGGGRRGGKRRQRSEDRQEGL
jgi:hypothetical protein